MAQAEGSNRGSTKLLALGCLGFIGVVLIIVLIGAAVIWGHRNTAVALDEQIKAQYLSNQSNYDNMWKRFKEMAQVTDMQADDMKKVYGDIISGRYQDSSLLFQMVQEQNPRMDSSLYTKLQNEVSAGRTEFDRNQKEVLDQIREYNTFIRKHVIMNAIFRFKELDGSKYMITSDRTSNAFETGKDDEIKLRE
ncbi:hypothetical protein [Cohnella zeiphila]|uniref:hypothetical protein n=1 Tax=Cohnella zeiphila TaxID=2761120 RepID=UPI001EE286E0|nr:hypothetical protein [Cohnella zeiphila]